MKILVTEKFNSQETPISLIKIGEVEEFDQWLPTEDKFPLITKIQQFKPDVLFVGLKHQFDKEILSACDSIKIIVTRTTGLDHIDLGYCQKQGIEILSLRGEEEFLKTIPATAELTMGLMIMLLRKSFHELKGKKIGIIGYGRIGKLIAKYAHAFDMEIDYYDIRGLGDLNAMLSNCDVISLNITADEKNRNFMDGTKFSMMKKGSWFLNSSRGWLVDELALKYNLLNGHLAGAWSDFPVDFEHPHMLVTPHLGGKTIESMIATELFMADKLIKYVTNKNNR